MPGVLEIAVHMALSGMGSIWERLSYPYYHYYNVVLFYGLSINAFIVLNS